MLSASDHHEFLYINKYVYVCRLCPKWFVESGRYLVPVSPLLQLIRYFLRFIVADALPVPCAERCRPAERTDTEIP